MSYTTLTRYLKLKIDSDLSADAVYNLQRIDALASTFVTDSTDKLKIQSKDDIEIEPNDTALGGTGSGGLIGLGTPDHNNIEIRAYSASFKVDSGIETKNQASGKTNYLKLAFEDSATTAEKTLKWKLSGTGNVRSLEVSQDGVVVTEDATQSLTNKTIDADNNTITNIDNESIKAGAGIEYSKLVLTGSVVDADLVAGINAAKLGDGSVSNTEFQYLNGVTGPLQTQLDGKASAGANSDITSLSGLTTALSIGQGGTGNDGSNKATALLDLLPEQTGNSNRILGLDSTGTELEWKTFAAGGTVDSVEAGTQLTLSLDGKTIGFNAGTSSQYLRGDNTWQTLDKSAVGLGNVDNTSDANKPVSSATQDALDLKYDASNPAGYVDASGAASAAVISGTPTWSETTQSPSASAIKTYVDANSGPKYSTTWAVADGNTKVVTHSLNTREVLVVLYDENYETVYVDSEVRTTVDSVTLTRVGTASGTWTVIIKKL